MAYTCNLLLRTLPAIDRELNPPEEEDLILFDLPRPGDREHMAELNSSDTVISVSPHGADQMITARRALPAQRVAQPLLAVHSTHFARAESKRGRV